MYLPENGQVTMENKKLNSKEDPLLLFNSKIRCIKCKENEESKCTNCNNTGWNPINLHNLWYQSSAFLVCGGPSINQIPYEKLSDRGIVSLGINNIATKVPVSAWCHTDGVRKFHHGLYFDPKCITFSPVIKFEDRVIAKLPDGSFSRTNKRLADCPNTFGFIRKPKFDPENFFNTKYAQWGETKFPSVLSTMFVGLRLLHYLGCQRVFLIGVDFEAQQGDQQYAFSQSKKGTPQAYLRYNKMLKKLKPIFDEHKFEVYNCNLNSKCTVFDYISFDDAFKICKGVVPSKLDTNNYYTRSIVDADVFDKKQKIKVKDLIKLQNENV
jgi:hypothetical protein